MEAMNAFIMELRLTMARMEEKIDNMNETMIEVKGTAKEASQIANQALNSTKSAHRRLDKIDTIIFWTATTIIGAVLLALIATVLIK